MTKRKADSCSNTSKRNRTDLTLDQKKISILTIDQDLSLFTGNGALMDYRMLSVWALQTY